ncbi:MAG TPA: hypothetical protein VMG82_39345 [Candidatus Sulfotelmatobacter sp.]|nr:hypothetical protein [Candidatus Sulfotelmatobacter sp.]
MLGTLQNFMFGQDPVSNQDFSPQTTSPDSSFVPESGGEYGHTQQTPTAPNLVDAPSTTQQTTCTQKNGKPCPAWVHKLIGEYPPVEVTERWNGQPDHFFTFGNTRRALHPDKKSWMLFTLTHAGLWASTVVAVGNQQTSKEHGHSEYPATAFMTGMDLLLFKTISPALSVGPAIYGTVHYSKAAAK